ncbi:DUF1302 domain-containing protein [Alkalimarinus alittae]|uniref:DUF1302 domain-containing protein n=1 Tax=Alkalimarinus alittae TaxID=2961619 RepID=A0ABY6MZC6_9ALTE|nr:DUF1302 domain-containing protein [Alkalimarinus alittae]UZE95188.1 DUF1302 domain-containing protein [Alkalimarinus alittae]
MTKNTQRWHKLAKLPLAVAVAASVSAPASAFQFYMGDVEASFDTTLSAGVSWRLEDRDTRQLSQGNLAPMGSNPYIGSTTGASTNNYDDGNWNFDKGDIYSNRVKGTSELLLSYENFGGFVRGRYWYDFQLKDEAMALDGAGQRRQLSSEGDKNASGGEFLDAYVWADFEIGNMPLNMRLGRQVLSWGESTFIFNGINVINPVDVGAIRAPGAEVKEALLPVNMFYSSIGLTENVTVEGFLQLEWEKTEIEDCGTFFSTADFAPNGCGPVLLAGQLPDGEAYSQGLYAGRNADIEADDTDQFGLAVRWYVPELNDSELGFYFVQYHSRVPLISGVVASDPGLGGSGSDNFPEYFMDYPEGIQMVGVSFNTSTESGYSIGGEVSYKKDLPIQWNSFELIHGGLAVPSSLLYQREVAKNGGDETQLFGQTLPGYDEFGVSQAQMTVIKFFDQVAGASRMTFVGEVGGTYIHGLPDKKDARYGRAGTYGIGAFDLTGSTTAATDGTPWAAYGTCTSGPVQNLNSRNCNNDGYTTSFSWGYRLRTALDYNDVYAGVNLTPTLSFSHDVKGYAPEPGGNFIEDRMSIGLALKAVYLNQYSANVSYTSYFSGGPYNLLNDRDNIAVSVAYSF